MSKRKNTYAGLVSQPTSQTQQAHVAQVPNSAGGWSFQVDHWTQLRRFLILGSEDGTYYIGAKELTVQNMQAVQKCLREDGVRTVQEIVTISQAGRAAKNSPAIFALALAALPEYASPVTNRVARASLSQVCRTATMLYEFCEIIQQIGKWNRGLRTAVSNWFTSKDADSLAYQLVKYRQRDGWTARDVLRLAHPAYTGNDAKSAVLRWAVAGSDGLGKRQVKRGTNTVMNYGDYSEDLPEIIKAFDMLHALKTNSHGVVELIVKHKLPRETLPTEWLNDAQVWAALLADMPYTAMLRNLATMTRVGLLDVTKGQMAAIAGVCHQLTDQEQIKKSRVHPIAILAALKTYQQGHGIKGHNSWLPNPRIIDALNDAFRMAFGNVQPYEGRVQIAIDVSGSMNNTKIVGLEYLSAIEGAAALALPMLHAMPNAFTTAFNTGHQDLTLTARMSLNEATQTINRKVNGGTDCAAPIIWAMTEKRVIDLFVILTDNETWAGGQHPFEALRQYRRTVNPNARLAVVAMCANSFTLNSPEDKGSIDLIGFDTQTPVILDGFARGEI